MANNTGNSGNDQGSISPQAAALGAASINALGQVAVNAARNKKQWKYQQRAMDKQQQLNLEAWNLQNAYNTPQQQMERLKAAGLNPRLIYGEGSSAPNMAGPLDVPEAPVRQATGGTFPDLLQYYQIRQMDAQYKNTVMATHVMEKTAALKDIEQGLKNLNLLKESEASKHWSHNFQVESSIKGFTELRAQQLYQNESRKGELMDQLQWMRNKQATSIELDNAFKQHRNELAKLGIYQTDHPLFRVLIQAAKRMNMDLGDLLGEGPEALKYLFDLKKD